MVHLNFAKLASTHAIKIKLHGNLTSNMHYLLPASIESVLEEDKTAKGEDCIHKAYSDAWQAAVLVFKDRCTFFLTTCPLSQSQTR